MALLLQLLAAAIALGLLVFEFAVVRPTDLRLAEPDAGGGTQSSEHRRVRQKALVRGGGVFGIAYGLLNFPATLAPVILVAHAAQAHPIGGDGTTALIGIVVAGYSMSASLKAIRAGEIYLTGQTHLLVAARQCVLFFLGWTAIVCCLLALSRPPVGNVALIVYGYVAVTFLASLVLKIADGAAFRRVSGSTPPPAQDPSVF